MVSQRCACNLILGIADSPENGTEERKKVRKKIIRKDKENIAKDKKVIPDPIDDRKFQE